MNQIIMILLISLLVLVHEAGHFIAARLCGVRVTRFGIGMPIGPSWKLFKWGNTVFYIHAFLFGGYVSFADDEPETQGTGENQANGLKAQVCETRDGDALSISEQSENHTTPESSELSDSLVSEDEEILPPDSPELYENKTIAQKLFIVSAGVVMNIVFAIFLVIFCATVFQKLPTSTQNIFVNGFAKEKTSNIETFDVKKGDKFHKINDMEINTMYQLILFAKNSKLFDDYAQEGLIEQNLQELKKLNPTIKDAIEVNQTIKLPKTKPENPLNVSKDILKGLEKYKKDGIELTKTQIELRNKIYNQKTYKAQEQTTLEDVAYALSDTYKPLKMTFIRNDKEFIINNVIVNQKGLLGILLNYEDIYEETKTPKDIVVKSCKYLYTTTSTMLYGLWQLITGKVPASDMHGIIAVTKLGGDIIASKGMLNGILLTAMISINLAIMNFLPIPALDGGHVMFLMIEKITGKKPSKEFSEKITNFFFMLLIFLMIAICYNDIVALITKKF